jgi:hypothetical protein
MKRLLVVLFALGCAASLAAQTCPYDCQMWSSTTGCVGAPTNGCAGYLPGPTTPPAPDAYPTASFPCSYAPVIGPGPAPSPGSMSAFPSATVPCSPSRLAVSPSITPVSPFQPIIIMPFPSMLPWVTPYDPPFVQPTMTPFAMPATWPLPASGSMATPTWDLPVNGTCPYECESLFGSVCVGPKQNGCGPHTCPYNCQSWNPAAGVCVGPPLNICTQ